MQIAAKYLNRSVISFLPKMCVTNLGAGTYEQWEFDGKCRKIYLNADCLKENSVYFGNMPSKNFKYFIFNIALK